MQLLSLEQLYQQYNQLRSQVESRQISHADFVQRAQSLHAQDQTGAWWMIDPQSGRYLTYRGNRWVPGTPPAAPAQVAPSDPAPSRAAPGRAGARPAAHRTGGGGGLRGCLGSPLMVGLLSIGSAVVWLAYTSFSPSSEGNDFKTPLIIAGVPLLLRLGQPVLDRLLAPLYKLLGAIPRPLLLGAAVATPLVIGGILTDGNASGFQELQRSAAFSVIIGYVLSRRPAAVAR